MLNERAVRDMVEKAIQQYGTAANLAHVLNVDPSAVTHWRKGQIPDAENCVFLMMVTNTKPRDLIERRAA